MLAARASAAVALRSVRANPAYVGMCRVSPRQLSGKPPEPAEVDDTEEIKQAMETIVAANGSFVSERSPATQPLESDFPGNPRDVLALDPLPSAQMGRKVIISQHCKAATTSGIGGISLWHLTFKNQERWSNPVMGWTSTADPMSNMELTFENPEQAIRFCKKRGWDYKVKKSAKYETVRGANAYSHNFLPHNVERDIKVNGQNTKHFVFPTAGASHYERPLSFHGTGVVKQHGNPEN